MNKKNVSLNVPAFKDTQNGLESSSLFPVRREYISKTGKLSQLKEGNERIKKILLAFLSFLSTANGRE